MTSIIEVKNLTKKFLKKTILDDVSLEVRQGEFLCLVGPSGCGKSTLLKLIIGIEQATSGSINTQASMSMVFQSGALLPWLNVLENASFGLKMKGVDERNAQETAKKYLDMVGLSDHFKKYPRELSGGQRQRVGIARALSMETEVLILDEPFSALDPVTTKELHEDLLKIWQSMGKTIIMVSHLLEEAVYLADRIEVMGEGKIKDIFEIDLPRPRDVRSKNFEELVKKVSWD